MRRLIQVSATAVAVVCLGGLAGPAVADPTGAKDATVFDLVCDDGTTTQVVANGGGNWAPALDVESNAVFVPVWFGEFTGTVTDAEGNVLDSFTDPPASKGAGNNVDLQCTFSGAFTFTDPDLGLITFEFTGDVAGFRTPRR